MKLIKTILHLLLFSGLILTPPVWAVEDDADQSLIESDPAFVQQYILQISGSAYKETFSGVRAILRISTSSTFDLNPYLVTIEGFPRQNTRNSFFWNSTDSSMEAVSNQITASLKNTVVKPADTHFYYLSPTLVETPGIFITQHEEERKREAVKIALPTRVYAQAGELRLRIYARTITGTVWLKGYDHIQNAYVLYRANIFGTKSLKLESQEEKK